MNTKNRNISALLLLGLILGCLAALGFFLLRGVGVTVGRCLITDNGACLLVVDNSPIVLSHQGTDEAPYASLQTGDKLFVLHDGIQETYPAKTDVYFCLRVGSGSIEDIPDQVITGLAELGWLSSQQESPQNTTIAQYSHQYANLSIALPKDWSHRTIPCFGEGECTEPFGLEFWPEAQPDLSFRLYYHPAGIGLCGTGVSFETMSFSSGLTATKCSEVIGNSLWLMVIFEDLPGTYALEAQLPADQWEEYENTILSILDSALLGQGLPTRPEVIRIAQDVCGEDLNSLWAFFDFTTGVWEVQNAASSGNPPETIVHVGSDGSVVYPAGS